MIRFESADEGFYDKYAGNDGCITDLFRGCAIIGVILLCIPLGLYLWITAEPWLERQIQLPDRATDVVVEVRSNYEFRTKIKNSHGQIVIDNFSQHVNLYLSPFGRLIVASDGTLPDVIDIKAAKEPARVPPRVLKFEYLKAARWKYLGAVNWTDDDLEWLPRAPECLSWGEPTAWTPKRAVISCMRGATR